jgi:hypothetical protein
MCLSKDREDEGENPLNETTEEPSILGERGGDAVKIKTQPSSWRATLGILCNTSARRSLRTTATESRLDIRFERP